MKRYPTVYFIIGDKAVGKSILANTVEEQGFLVVRTFSPRHGPDTIKKAFLAGMSVFVDVDASNATESLIYIREMQPIFRRYGYEHMKIIQLSPFTDVTYAPKPEMVVKSRRGYSRLSGVGDKTHGKD